MPDERTTSADVHLSEVLTSVVDNYVKDRSMFLGIGLAVLGAAGEVEWSKGGRHVTRVEFLGKLAAKNLAKVRAATVTNTKQKVSYGESKWPLVSSIVSTEIEGETEEDLYDNEGYMNRLTRHVNETALEDVDRTLTTYTADIGESGGEKDYGALGTDLSYDTGEIADDPVKTMTYDHLVRARGKFGDSPGPLLFCGSTQCMTDLLLTTEAKNMQQGIVIGGQSGVYFPAINTFAVQSDRTPYSAEKYTNVLGKPGCMTYVPKGIMRVISKYNDDFLFQKDFVWRFAILRNIDRGRQMVLKLLAKSNQAAPAA